MDDGDGNCFPTNGKDIFQILRQANINFLVIGCPGNQVPNTNKPGECVCPGDLVLDSNNSDECICPGNQIPDDINHSQCICPANQVPDINDPTQCLCPNGQFPNMTRQCGKQCFLSINLIN